MDANNQHVKNESEGAYPVYINIVRDKDGHPFPQPSLPDKEITENTKNDTKCKNQHPFELPAIPEEKDPTAPAENSIYDQLDYWPIGQWPKFRQSWKERLNPLQLRNKTIFIILLLALCTIVAAVTLICIFFIAPNTHTAGKIRTPSVNAKEITPRYRSTVVDKNIKDISKKMYHALTNFSEQLNNTSHFTSEQSTPRTKENTGR